MTRRLPAAAIPALLVASPVAGQRYDILIKGGTVGTARARW